MDKYTNLGLSRQPICAFLIPTMHMRCIFVLRLMPSSSHYARSLGNNLEA